MNRDTREIIHALMIEPSTTRLVTVGETRLITDRYVLLDLSTVPDYLDHTELSLPRTIDLDGMPADGFYEWGAYTGPLPLGKNDSSVFREVDAVHLGNVWERHTERHQKMVKDGLLRLAEWSTWACGGARQGLLDGKPVAVADLWLRRLAPGWWLAGDDPRKPLSIVHQRNLIGMVMPVSTEHADGRIRDVVLGGLR